MIRAPPGRENERENILGDRRRNFKDAWSIENMEAHGAGGRSVSYVGSTRKGDILTDYYKDSAGQYWFENRGIRNGEIMSMDRYIFGHEIKRRKRKS